VTSIKPALGAAARRAIAARVLALLDRLDARDDLANVLADPVATSELCALLATPHRDPDGEPRIDVVVGAGEVGAILAFETARQLRARFDLGPATRPLPLPGARILVVGPEVPDDALARLADAVTRAGAALVECAVVVDRTEGRPRLTSARGRVHPLRALVRIDRTDARP
jgi:adenine/guanine phosphoribosyltransferase-like PRPP-binding protein